MQGDYKKVKPTIWLSQETLDKIDALKATDHTAQSRGAIVEKAVEFYKSHIDLNQDIDFFAPMIKAIVENTMNVYVERLNRNVFKNAVETNVLTRCVSKVFSIDEETYQRIRKKAVEDAKRTKGSIVTIADTQEDDVPSRDS